MILGICSGLVYITLNLFIIIVLETGSMLVADKYTNNATSGKPAVTRTKSSLGINNFLVFWIENLSRPNFKHFHISTMSNNRITAHYEFL